MAFNSGGFGSGGQKVKKPTKTKESGQNVSSTRAGTSNPKNAAPPATPPQTTQYNGGGDPRNLGGGSSPVVTGGGQGNQPNPLFNTGSPQTRTAFGDYFMPGAYGEAWANPEAVIRSFFRQKGMPTNTGAEAMLQQMQPSLGIQWLIAQGDKSMEGTPNYLDWTGQQLEQALTPGGKSLGTMDVLDALLNPQSDVLKQHLSNANLTPADQVQNMLSALRYGEQPNMPTPVLNALLARAEDLGRNFQAIRMHQAGNNTFGDYLNQQNFGR